MVLVTQNTSVNTINVNRLNLQVKRQIFFNLGVFF